MPVDTKTDESRQIAQYWNAIAPDFDAIYTGKKNFVSRGLDHWLRKEMYQRFEWVMRKVRLKIAGCPVYFWERQQVENYLERAGFRVQSCTVLGQLHCFEARSV